MHFLNCGGEFPGQFEGDTCPCPSDDRRDWQNDQFLHELHGYGKPCKCERLFGSPEAAAYYLFHAPDNNKPLHRCGGREELPWRVFAGSQKDNVLPDITTDNNKVDVSCFYILTHRDIWSNSTHVRTYNGLPLTASHDRLVFSDRDSKNKKKEGVAARVLDIKKVLRSPRLGEAQGVVVLRNPRSSSAYFPSIWYPPAFANLWDTMHRPASEDSTQMTENQK
jgi:hypothetical protein